LSLGWKYLDHFSPEISRKAKIPSKIFFEKFQRISGTKDLFVNYFFVENFWLSLLWKFLNQNSLEDSWKFSFWNPRLKGGKTLKINFFHKEVIF